MHAICHHFSVAVVLAVTVAVAVVAAAAGLISSRPYSKSFSN